MSRTGLTLGKFAPLHKGHELVIETMLSEMDRGIAIIYNTDVTPIPLPVRAQWLRRRFPQLQVIEAWEGPEGSPGPEYEAAEEAYVRSLLGETRVDAFYCSEYYGAHMSAALKCQDRRVDEARTIVPISATEVRQDPYQHRSFVSDLVYRDLIIKVVFVGAMSTGKTAITEALARRFNTRFVSEYGREYWETHQIRRRIALAAFDEIAEGHIRREEEAVLTANRYLFVDTNAITTYMYAQDYHGKATPGLTQTALLNASRYDLFFLCQDDIPYDDTWDRSGDAKRQVFQQQIIADLEMRRIPYIPLAGTLEARMAKVETVLAGYIPYQNYFGRTTTNTQR